MAHAPLLCYDLSAMGKKCSNKAKLIIIAASAVLIAIICLICLQRSDSAESLTITNLNVGKADSAVIACSGQIGVIDTGTEDSYDRIDSFLKEIDASGISFLLLTHYDKDHIGSAVKLLENYQIDTVYLPDYVSEKALYPPLMEYLSKKDYAVSVNSITKIKLGDSDIDIIPAEDPDSLLENENNRDNDMSLVCMLSYKGYRFLFTGDIENDRMKQMLKSSYDLSCDWIKIPHHGVYDKKLGDLLDRSAPSYAVISTSEEKAPEEKMIRLLDERSIKYCCTMNGDVTTRCNGMSVSCSQ